MFATALLWALYRMPLERQAGTDGPSLLVEARNGEALGRVGPLANSVRRQDFPDMLVRAVLSIEDRRFYGHWGIDPWGIARAMRANWAAGDVVEGGSTITQQLAKMEVVGGERSLHRKLREALTAVWLELRLGKEEILTRYLNTVYLGAGAHGMSAAARMYFDKSLSKLTLAEAALLAGLDSGAFQIRSGSQPRCGAAPGHGGHRRHARDRGDRCESCREGKSRARGAEAFTGHRARRQLVRRLDRQA